MYTLDRFARNRYDSAIYKAKLKKNGVRVYYAKQPMPDTPEGIILESVLEGYAEYYSENLARNIKRGIRENALQGLATGGANLLLGYTVGEDRKYAIDPTGAKIVQEIFQLYADGMSATQIIAYCNERGYKTATLLIKTVSERFSEMRNTSAHTSSWTLLFPMVCPLS